MKTRIGIGLLLCALAGCESSSAKPSGTTCVLCAPSGSLSCAAPGVDPCPGSQPGQSLPVCGVIAGYSVALTDCGGATINGLRCATDCSWQIGSDPSAELNGHPEIVIAPGCTLDVAAEPGVCVVNCSDCQ